MAETAFMITLSPAAEFVITQMPEFPGTLSLLSSTSAAVLVEVRSA
jgi:hypothetical protein